MSNRILACASTTQTEHHMRRVAELMEEKDRIETLIRSVDESIEVPYTPFEEAMRLVNWSKQLEGYLEGIRFALGEPKRFRTQESIDE
jgi:hypothetical protein